MHEGDHGNVIAQHLDGTAEEARHKVRAYFDDLRETVNRQEEAGLAVVNNYVREKLLSLRQQQEDMAVLMSQVTSVCVECERALKRSDAEVSWHICRVVLQQYTDSGLLYMSPVTGMNFALGSYEKFQSGFREEKRSKILGTSSGAKFEKHGKHGETHKFLLSCLS